LIALTQIGYQGQSAQFSQLNFPVFYLALKGNMILSKVFLPKLFALHVTRQTLLLAPFLVSLFSIFNRILSCIPVLDFQLVDFVAKILMKEKIAMRKIHAVIAENADILLSNAVPRSPTRLPTDVSKT